MLESCYLAKVEKLQAATFLRQLFAVDGQLRLLDGERDLNFLVNGEVLADGIPQQILENKMVRKIYLGDDFKL